MVVFLLKAKPKFKELLHHKGLFEPHFFLAQFMKNVSENNVFKSLKNSNSNTSFLGSNPWALKERLDTRDFLMHGN